MQTDGTHILKVNGYVTCLFVTLTKYPKRSNLKEEGLFEFRVQEVNMVGEGMVEKHDVIGHTV